MRIVTKHSEGQREYLFKISDKDHGYNSPVYYWNDGAAKPHWQKLWAGHGYQHLLEEELGYEDSEVVALEHGDGDCGSHPIGSDCAKKLAKVIKKENVEPKGYIHFADLEDNLLVSKEKK